MNDMLFYLRSNLIPKKPLVTDFSFDNVTLYFQINAITPYLDMHLIYGVSTERNKELRTFINGKLKTLEKNGQHFPINSPNPSAACPSVPNATRCFYGGKVKKNNNELNRLEKYFSCKITF